MIPPTRTPSLSLPLSLSQYAATTSATWLCDYVSSMDTSQGARIAGQALLKATRYALSLEALIVVASTFVVVIVVVAVAFIVVAVVRSTLVKAIL